MEPVTGGCTGSLASFSAMGRGVGCCGNSTMWKPPEQTQIPSPANTCCRPSLERAGTRGRGGGKSPAAERARARGRRSPRRSRPGLRASARAPAGPERRERPGTREDMEGEALCRGRARCAASYALGGESREGQVLRDGEEKGRITSWVRRADLGRTRGGAGRGRRSRGMKAQPGRVESALKPGWERSDLGSGGRGWKAGGRGAVINDPSAAQLALNGNHPRRPASPRARPCSRPARPSPRAGPASPPGGAQGAGPEPAVTAPTRRPRQPDALTQHVDVSDARARAAPPSLSECRPGRGGGEGGGRGGRGDPGVVVGRGPDRVPGRREPGPGGRPWQAVGGPPWRSGPLRCRTCAPRRPEPPAPCPPAPARVSRLQSGQARSPAAAAPAANARQPPGSSFFPRLPLLWPPPPPPFTLLRFGVLLFYVLGVLFRSPSSWVYIIMLLFCRATPRPWRPKRRWNAFRSSLNTIK